MNKIKNVAEEYGRLYVKQYLTEALTQKDEIYTDWCKGLKFFFSKSFNRGRRDILSKKFRERAIRTLDKFGIWMRLNQQSLNQQLLEEALKENGVNNEVDRKMVVKTLDFISKLPSWYENNIVRYTVEEIKKGNIKAVYEKLDNIYGIGDKLTSFYLRDVVILYGLEKSLTKNDLKYCQPIDTWVKQVAYKLGIIKSTKDKITLIKDAIIDRCLEVEVSPLLFNAGAWLIGARSLDLLIDKL